jgi:hypothetical protein
VNKSNKEGQENSKKTLSIKEALVMMITHLKMDEV